MSRLAGGPPEDPVSAIARNLSAVLNAKRGYAGAVRTFGLGDHAIYEESKPQIDAIVADITDQVRRFEPRLEGPAVRFAGLQRGGLWARFEISGKVQGARRTFVALMHVILRNVDVLPLEAP